ncbi:hypothetical protein C8T65DRAFT_709616 [Cerioporus squamosus]|nr:hypothetical protein C8T65DRAFT_709616 [Cerioporus squamosus]
MHNLFLGELRHHCMEVWGIDIKDKPAGPKIRAHTPEEQTKNIDKVMALRKGSASALDKLRKGYIVTIARLNNVPPSGGDQRKASYIKSLIEWAPSVDFDTIRRPQVLDYDTAEFHLVADGPQDISKFRVLSYEVLQLIRKDIASTVLPSWLERPPSNFGSAKHGKLKADQWRTVCTVNMVITLVRLWTSSGATKEEKELLDNFLHLIAADIFDHQFVPNHHLSLHLYSCLLLFGPVHGWWAFPFERYNGLIANLNTNNKPADMPITFLRYFYIGANVRRLMATMQWPDDPAFIEMLDSFQNAFGDVVRGTRMVDALHFGNRDNGAPEHKYDIEKESRLPEFVYEGILRVLNASGGAQFLSAYAAHASTRAHATLNPNGQEVPRVTREKVDFATADKGLRNSFVMFRAQDGSPEDGLRAGQISKIFLHARKKDGVQFVEPFLLINTYQPLTDNDAARDPYRRWPDINTRLYYNRFEHTPRVVSMADVVSHFASYVYSPEDIAQECIVVRNLDRKRREVRWSLWTTHPYTVKSWTYVRFGEAHDFTKFTRELFAAFDVVSERANLISTRVHEIAFNTPSNFTKYCRQYLGQDYFDNLVDSEDGQSDRSGSPDTQASSEDGEDETLAEYDSA